MAKKIYTRIIGKRVLISLFIIICIRFGSFLPLPGIDQKVINFYFQTSSIPQNIIRNFSNKGPFLVNFFTLNIFPYINAAIFAQLIFSYFPSLSKLRNENSLASRRKITRGIRFLTCIWAVVQGAGISLYFYRISLITNLNWNLLLFIKISIWLTTGAMIVLWLSDLITDYGLGNGTSLFVCTNIASNFPNLYQKLISGDFKSLTVFSRFSFIALFFLMIMIIVFLQFGETRVNFISATQLNRQFDNKSKNLFQTSFQTDIEFYIPLKVNQTGIMPIIFTTTILALPYKILETVNFLPMLVFQMVYWLIYFIVLLQFSYFYSNITLNPKDLSNQLQKMTSVIPGIRPGDQTTFYLTNLLKRLTTITTSILVILSAFPKIIVIFFNIYDLGELSAISFVIIIGVLVDINRESDDVMYANKYNRNR